MYGLKQAGYLANQNLQQHLKSMDIHHVNIPGDYGNTQQQIYSLS